MGDAQSAQREGKQDAAAAGEEGGKVEDVQTEHTIDDKPPKTNGQISELNGKADSSIAALNGNCEEDIAAVDRSPDKNAPELLKEEETPLKSNDIDPKELPDEGHADDVPTDITEMEAKQNDINESFKKFFSNIGLKLTVKRGSTDKVPEEEQDESAESAKDTTNEISFDNTEPETHLNTAQEAHDSDSPTYQTLIDITCEEFIEKEEEKKTADMKEEVTSDDADAGTSSPVSEDAHQGATSEEEPHQTSPSSPDTKEIGTQFKRFFTSGIFSGLRKKKKSEEEDVIEKELVDMGERMSVETLDQEQDEEEFTPGVERATAERQLKGDDLTAGPTQTINEAKSSRTTELETPNLQEKDKSPLKKLIPGSSVKKLPKKQKGRKSSDAKLSDSIENISDQLLSSTESTGNNKEEAAAQPSTDTAEEGAWASFIKLMTPQRRSKRPSVDQGEVQIPGPADGAKPGKAEQISDRSTEEGRKRKDSSVSWEAVLCGSGRRRSHKTSDSEEDNEENKQDGEPKEGPLGTSNEVHEVVAPEDNEGSTWKSFKKLVTPKRKVSQDENKDTQSDSEVAQDDSSFSIKKFLSGRKKRKSVEKPDQIYSDEGDKEAASADEDETPAVVPLSEFDAPEVEVQTQTQADVESYAPKQADDELQQDILDEIREPIQLGDSLPTEEEEIQEDKEALDDNHQQLSDIPEEGAVTDTTPGSITEVAARDDTMAEDLIEITSEAVTAQEPVDVTLADETEMVSAVSQLSESSKTSGNTTPVPAEYNITNTELLLQQVTETITESPKSVPVCSEEESFERLVCSVSHQLLESSVIDQPKILEVHRRSDVAILKTDLNSKPIDAVDELAAEAQTESASHLNEVISTEIVSEVPTEEIGVAKPAADEVHKVDVSELQESVNELEIPDESHHVAEPVSEISKPASAEHIPEEEEGEVSPSDEAVIDQGAKEFSKTDSQEGESVAMLAVETDEAALKEEVKILLEKEDKTLENATEQVPTVGPTSATVDQLEDLTAVETAALDSEECKVQQLEVPPSEDNSTPKIDMDGPKQTVEHLSEVNDESENKEPEIDALKIDDAKVTEALEVIRASTLESEEGTAESESIDVLSPEMDKDELKQTDEHLAEVTGELEKEAQTDAVKTEDLEVDQADTSEYGEGSAESLHKVQSSEDIPPSEMDKDELKQTDEHLAEVTGELEKEDPQTDAVKTEDLEVDQADTSEYGEGSAESLHKVQSSEDIPPSEMDKDELKQTDEDLAEVTGELENKEPQTDAEVDQADTSEYGEGSAESLNKVQSSEDIPPSEMDKDELKQTHVLLTEESVPGEKVGECPGVEVKATGSDYAVVEQVVTCSLKDVSLEKPNVLVHEPAISRIVGEAEFCGQVETAEPLVQENINEISDTGSMVVMMHVPSVEFEEHQKVQVQLMDVDIRSAENNFDTVIEVGVTQTKEVIDVCHETIQKVENLSAAPVVEGEACNERIKVTVQEVIRHAQRTEAIPESVVVNLERVLKQLDAMTDRSEEEQSESNKLEGPAEQRPDEAPAVISEGSPVQDEDLVPIELKQKSESPDSLDASIHKYKEDLKETEIDLEKSEVHAAAEELAVKKLHEITAETESPRTTQSQIVSHSNAGLAVPQNTGLVSSVSNTESPSSLSLEFKLNIQFGQTKGPTPPPPTTETTGSVKQADASEVGVQAAKEVEPAHPRNAAQKAESEKQPELTEVAVQATQVQEPAADWHSTQRAVITSQPVLQDVGIQAMEIIEPVEQIKCTERVELMVHAAETIQPQQKERTTVLLRKTALSETKEIFKSVDEESQDQDVWLDAEEDICMQEEAQMSTQEVKKPSEEQTKQVQTKRAEVELEQETLSENETEDKENQGEMHKTSTCEIESEGEDFAVAPEDLESTVPAV
ncbi:uncharacterized protein akap12a [Xenentodon cancila]